jgi:hypothetical protein
VGIFVFSSTPATAVDDRLTPQKTLVVFDLGEPGETDGDDGALNILVAQGIADTLLEPVWVDVAGDDIADRGGEAGASYASPLMADDVAVTN